MRVPPGEAADALPVWGAVASGGAAAAHHERLNAAVKENASGEKSRF